MKNKGFTLIELLVVIAIIGILSSIVLVSLSGATKRAHDGRIISDMDQVRTAAQLYVDNQSPSTYVGVDSDGDINSLETDISDMGGTSPTWAISSTAYCFEVKLNATNGWYCVDSLLRSKQYSTTSASGTTCGGTTYTCQ